MNPEERSILAEDTRSQLSEIVKGCFDFTPLITKDGTFTPYYVNGQVVTSQAAGLYLAATIIFGQVQEWGIEAVAGEVAGASPLLGAVIALSYQAGTPLRAVYIRKEAKSYGLSGLINVSLPAGTKVAMVDDVSVSGLTALRCYDILQKAELQVEGFACIIDKRRGAKEKIEATGLKYFSIYSVDDFADYIQARIAK